MFVKCTPTAKSAEQLDIFEIKKNLRSGARVRGMENLLR